MNVPMSKNRMAIISGSLAAVFVAAFLVFQFTTPEPPKARSEFTGPLPFDSLKGDHSRHDLPRSFSRKLSIQAAISEYADLTGRSDTVPIVFWLRCKDDYFRRFLRIAGITRRIEAACKGNLPRGSIEFARQQNPDVTSEPKSLAEGRVSLGYETAGIPASSWGWDDPIFDTDHMVRESPSLRVLNLWAALRNEGVELLPVGTNRIRAIWHPTGSKSPPF